MPTAGVDEMGQVRGWAGAKAGKLGLVDHMGGLDVAVAEAARRAGLDPAKARAIYIEKCPALPFQILDDLLMETIPAQRRDPWGGPVAFSQAALVRAFADPQAITRDPPNPTHFQKSGLPEGG